MSLLIYIVCIMEFLLRKKTDLILHVKIVIGFKFNQSYLPWSISRLFIFYYMALCGHRRFVTYIECDGTCAAGSRMILQNCGAEILDRERRRRRRCRLSTSLSTMRCKTCISTYRISVASFVPYARSLSYFLRTAEGMVIGWS